MPQFVGTDNSEFVPGLVLAPVSAIGDDTLFGLGGDDVLTGWTGNDILNGGAGADVLIGGILNVVANIGSVTLAGNDTADYSTSTGGVTIDLSQTSSLNVSILGLQIGLTDAVTGRFGDAEGDVLVGIANLTGSGSTDNLIGDAGANILRGLGGNDYIAGGLGADLMDGGDGYDAVSWYGLSGGVTIDLNNQANNALAAAGDIVQNFEAYALTDAADNFTAGVADATIYGFGGNDIIAGGLGNDQLFGGEGADILNGAGGFDTANYSGSVGGIFVNVAAGTVIDGTSGPLAGSTDTIANIEQIVGSTFGADLYSGSEGVDYFAGLGGDDYVVYGGAGSDVFNGGDGFDTVSYYDSAAGIFADLRSGLVADGLGGTDAVISFEQIYGSNTGNDSITGSSIAESIDGFGGNDVIAGLGGSDMLRGGGGNDTFVYLANDFSGGNLDTILDFGTTSGDQDHLLFVGMSRQDLVLSASGSDTLISTPAGGGSGILVQNVDVATLEGWLTFA